jgi:predicted deacetylase
VIWIIKAERDGVRTTFGPFTSDAYLGGDHAARRRLRRTIRRLRRTGWRTIYRTVV